MEVQEPASKEASDPYDSSTFDRDVSIHVNEAVGAASISPSGRDIVLASRNGLYIIDLDSPYSPPRHLPHRSPWEIADVQWSPNPSRAQWIVSTSNQKALVWNLELASARTPIEHVLHAHQRAITDINFSGHHPDMLATCAVDSYVHCWDLRRSARPVMTFADWFAGATQVKYNRLDPHILASAHDKVLRIWDDRKGAFPLRSIDAHKTKIYGIDWNRTEPMKIMTCSLDKTIKFWDCTEPKDTPYLEFRTPYPVWRARHTPFGTGALAMPQRGDFNLHLYDRRKEDGTAQAKAATPVHSFDGHTDHVKEFLWRARGGVSGGIDNREFQLVSWGTDRHLRLHRMDPEVLEQVGYQRGKSVDSGLKIMRLGAVYKTFRDLSDSDAMSGGQLQGLSAMFRAASAIGMSKRPVHGHHSRTASDVQGHSPATGMQTRGGEKKAMNPIRWMEGVKIGKRETTDEKTDRLTRSVISPDQPFRWDSPDSLGDEITYVGGKFRKVHFEEVDVGRRTATVTLNGPWGADDKPAFVRVGFSFPKDYPVAAPAECTLLKTTSSMSDERLARLQVGVRSIAETYRWQRRGCFEAVIGYLLGERGLEESISWFDDDKLNGAYEGGNEESSSDEEDVIDADFTPEQQQEMEMSGTDIIGPANANANVPLPKGCGAVWHTDGRLVCFFPPKPEPRPIFNFTSLKAHERLSRSQKLSGGLQRLYNDSPDGRLKSHSGQEDDDQGSSDGSWMSTSSSSDSEELVGPVAGQFPPPAAWRGAASKMQRSSQVSSAGYQARLPQVKTKSIISIHSSQDLQDLLPAKKCLAEGYQIFGEGAYVCENNAAVARQHGCEDLADIWDIVKIILSKVVPLEILSHISNKSGSTLVMARRALVRIKKKHSGLDLAFDEAVAAARPKLKGRVKWGDHPFARSWLITSLFNHFERLADVQMLAMLSCMFSEPAIDPAVVEDMVNSRENVSSISIKSPAFSLDYFPSIQVAASLLQPTISIPSSPNPDLTPARVLNKLDNRLGTYGSAGSSDLWGSDAVASDPATPYSTGTTPPVLSRSNTRSSFTYGHSESPEQHQPVKRSQSNLATAFATLSRGFSNTASSSPPAGKFVEETDLSTSAPNTTVTWGANSFYNIAAPTNSGTPKVRGGRRHSSVTHAEVEISDEDAVTPDQRSKQSPSMHRDGGVTISLTLKNQDKFDDEGCVTAPLLDPALNLKYRAYRASYADFLHSWGLAIARSELLKFNGMASEVDDEYNSIRAIEGSKTAGQYNGIVNVKNADGISKPSRNGPVKGLDSCAVCFELISGSYIVSPDGGLIVHLGCKYAVEGLAG